MNTMRFGLNQAMMGVVRIEDAGKANVLIPEGLDVTKISIISFGLCASTNPCYLETPAILAK